MFELYSCLRFEFFCAQNSPKVISINNQNSNVGAHKLTFTMIFLHRKHIELDIYRQLLKKQSFVNIETHTIHGSLYQAGWVRWPCYGYGYVYDIVVWDVLRWLCHNIGILNCITIMMIKYWSKCLMQCLWNTALEKWFSNLYIASRIRIGEEQLSDNGHGPWY